MPHTHTHTHAHTHLCRVRSLPGQILSRRIKNFTHSHTHTHTYTRTHSHLRKISARVDSIKEDNGCYTHTHTHTHTHTCAGSVPEQISSRRMRDFSLLFTTIVFSVFMCDENEDRSSSTVCWSPMDARMLRNKSTRAPSSHGTQHPCCTSSAHRPTVCVCVCVCVCVRERERYGERERECVFVYNCARLCMCMRKKGSDYLCICVRM